MEPEITHKSALDTAREARKRHETGQGTYRDCLHRAIADVVRTVERFNEDSAGYDALLSDPFFQKITAKTGRKRDTSNKYSVLSKFIFNADSREKEKTVNIYGNVAWFYADKGVSPDDIPQQIELDGGVKEVAKLAAERKKLIAASVENEIWGDLIAVKIWMAKKHFDKAMGIRETERARLIVRRVKSSTDYKEFVCEGFKRKDLRD